MGELGEERGDSFIKMEDTFIILLNSPSRTLDNRNEIAPHAIDICTCFCRASLRDIAD
jgi:hypothetical protein